MLRDQDTTDANKLRAAGTTTTCRFYRQAEIYARAGVSLETSTPSGCNGATAAAPTPLVDALATDIISSDTLHVDDTPVPVLGPGNGRIMPDDLPFFRRVHALPEVAEA